MTYEQYSNLKTGDTLIYCNKEYKVVESLFDFNFTLMHIVEDNNGNRSIFNTSSMRFFNLKHE